MQWGWRWWWELWSLKIALDWDETCTRNLDFWRKFVHLCKVNNVDVRIVTMRHYSEIDDEMESFGIPIHFTGRKQKRPFMDKGLWYPDIWIDDSPEFIVDWDLERLINVRDE
jgi:hypothetical protein